MNNKNSVKKFLGAAVALVVVASLVAPAFAAKAPKDPDGRGTIPLEYLGAKACRVNQTTSPKECATASGLLYQVCAFGTAVAQGKGAIAFDSANPTHGSPDLQKTTGISPIVYGTSSNSTDSTALWAVKCWTPPVPVRFENGLGLVTDSTSVSVLAIYRLDSGVNP